MTDNVQIALIAATPPTLVALGAIVVAWMGRSQSKKNADQIGVVHLLINNRMDQLLAASKLVERSAGHAEGIVEGRQLGITERHDRTVESERVEDRADRREKNS
jgi:hypothetical protein